MQTYIFLHQVKTAGKTVEKFLVRKFREKYCRTTTVFKDESIENIFSILDSTDESKIAEINRAQIISGHFPYGIHKLLNSEARYFTLLRDPVSRIRSYYAYSMRNHDSKIYQYLTENNISFEQFVEMEPDEIAKTGVHELNYVLEDGQAKIIAGENLIIGDSKTDHLMQTAQDNISRHFDFVGVTELFDDAFIEISKLLGFGPFSLYITQNKSTVKVNISEQARKVILERNPIDKTLHTKYMEQLQSQSNTFINQLARGYLSVGSRAADVYAKLRS